MMALVLPGTRQVLEDCELQAYCEPVSMYLISFRTRIDVVRDLWRVYTDRESLLNLIQAWSRSHGTQLYCIRRAAHVLKFAMMYTAL